MTLRVAVVGGGVVGACCARVLAPHAEVRWWVGTEEPCALRAGGMLAPLSEVDHAEPPLVRAGLDSVARWRALLGDDAAPLAAEGSLLTALRPEWPLLEQWLDRVRRGGWADRVRVLDRAQLAEVEPGLDRRFVRGVWVDGEGVVDPPAALAGLRARLVAQGVTPVSQQVDEVGPGRVVVQGETIRFDEVVDARGLGAREAWPLRGVRGEYLEVEAPEVSLRRPVRVLHPRHPLYVIPRGGGRFYVGATEIERDDAAPITVRSALELLSALYAVHPALGEASILRSGVGLRPALPDNAPRVVRSPGLVAVNGLHRHGWLLSPILAEAVDALVRGGQVPAAVADWVEAR